MLKRDGNVVKTRSKQLKVGDLVRIKCDQYLPADIVPLTTSLDDGICYIETAQLDGYVLVAQDCSDFSYFFIARPT